MHSLDEQMQEITKREAALRSRQHHRRTAILSGLSCVGCTALIAATACWLPFIKQTTDNAVPVYYGSALFGTPAAGLVVIILLSFALGVSVTLLCRALRKGRNEK
ncbi:MAG: hypothetical protein LKJ90_02730 [Faecalibacterium sp.]|jgi:hypothetical protein|nr:hypothetical protein [Faecalibacterium sp.]